MRLSLDELNKIVVCPNCRKGLQLKEIEGSLCAACGESYQKLPFSWHLIPSSIHSFELLETWQQLQENGLIAYTEDPDNNLSIGERQDCLDFAGFCQCDGLVLDIGCGIQPWPSYFAAYSDRTRFIGVDPLVGNSSAEYVQIRSVAELLPFADKTFDNILFATSLDHVIDPMKALTEVRRISKSNGEINIWIGEKSAQAPKPSNSHQWYERLKKPEGADDVFHYHRLNADTLESYFGKADLHIIDEKRQRKDEFRARYFFKLKP